MRTIINSHRMVLRSTSSIRPDGTSDADHRSAICTEWYRAYFLQSTSCCDRPLALPHPSYRTSCEVDSQGIASLVVRREETPNTTGTHTVSSVAVESKPITFFPMHAGLDMRLTGKKSSFCRRMSDKCPSGWLPSLIIHKTFVETVCIIRKFPSQRLCVGEHSMRRSKTMGIFYSIRPYQYNGRNFGDASDVGFW